jgi:SAM-dependent methyltransferase
MSAAPGDPIAAHYSAAGLLGRVESALRDAGLDPDHLDPDDLRGLEEFHTLGRHATVTLAEQVGLAQQADGPATVVDVGAGLGGPARLLARRYGCRVAAIDLTADYCALARRLNRATGLDDRVTVWCADALNLPLVDAAVDIVWTQHAQMNIADKGRLYRELRRVLRRGGRLALWDVVAGGPPFTGTHSAGSAGEGAGPADGNRPVLHFPVPWADDPAISHLVTSDELTDHLTGAGFGVLTWEDATADGLASLTRAAPASGGPPGLGLHLVVPDLRAKAANFARNLAEGRVGLVRAVLEAR